MTSQQTSASASSAWDAFSARHVGHPFLGREPLYALSEAMVDQIKKELPNFFTPDEESFERDLAQTASFGFFRGRAFGRTSLNGDEGDASDNHVHTHWKIRDMLRTEYRSEGAADWEIDESFRFSAACREDINSRKAAYIGWLILDKTFRNEVARLKDAWQEEINRHGVFPRHPFWLDPGIEPARHTTELSIAFQMFYSRWGLQQLLTWDWPVPLDPDFVGGLIQDQTGEAGLSLFIPWYLLRGEKISVQDVIRATRPAQAPAHLRKWILPQGKKRGKLGDQRYERICWLYRFRILAIRSRYHARCYRQDGRLDAAFAALKDKDVESVCRLRRLIQDTVENEG